VGRGALGRRAGAGATDGAAVDGRRARRRAADRPRRRRDVTPARGAARAATRASALVALVLCAACGLEPAGGITLRHATMVVDAGPSPPAPDDPRWRAVTLPDRWPRARRDARRFGWYRAAVHLDARPDVLWAVALPLVVQNAAVRVNGQPVGDGGRFAPPMARNWNRPLLVTVPAVLLRPGENTIEVRLGSSGVAPPVLGPLVVGPASALAPAHARLTTLQVGVAEATTATAVVVVGLLALLLWRGEYFVGGGWLVAALGLVTLTSVDGFLHQPPVPTALWDWLVTALRTAAVVCGLAGIHRHLGLARRHDERVAWTAWAASMLVLAVVPAGWLLDATVLVYAGAAVVAARALRLLARHRRQTAPRVVAGFLVVGAVGVAFGLHDVLRLAGVPMLPLFLTPWGFTVVVGVEAAVVTTRLVRAFGGLVVLNRELESRVAAKHAELEQAHTRVLELERQRIVAEERQRITRDIHDGLGGHLVTTLAMLESADEFSRDDVAEALRGALDDLRLVIDSLDPRETDLVSVLATVRSRLEPRLRRRGLGFRWDVADLPPSPGFGPERLLRVMRVVQEAITNVLKHAGATTITVRTGVAGGRAFVSVADDGQGFVAEHAEGRGLVNMRRRAAELGGELALATGAGGTTVTLWLGSAG